MKKIVTFLVAFTVSTLIYAQLPQQFSYQAIVRGANNALLSNQKVGIKISLLKGTENGQSVYSEVHTATTNANGLVSIAVGGGNLLEGNFVKIDWANGPGHVDILRGNRRAQVLGQQVEALARSQGRKGKA